VRGVRGWNCKGRTELHALRARTCTQQLSVHVTCGTVPLDARGAVAARCFILRTVAASLLPTAIPYDLHPLCPLDTLPTNAGPDLGSTERQGAASGGCVGPVLSHARLAPWAASAHLDLWRQGGHGCEASIVKPAPMSMGVNCPCRSCAPRCVMNDALFDTHKFVKALASQGCPPATCFTVVTLLFQPPT